MIGLLTLHTCSVSTYLLVIVPAGLNAFLCLPHTHTLLLCRCFDPCLHEPRRSQPCSFTMEMFVFGNCKLALAFSGSHCMIILLNDILSFRAACSGN